MNENANSTLTGNAQSLRKSMTKEERHLWYDFLKSLPVTVHRQKVIGCYIADFYIASAKLVIEIDGSQHYEASGMQADEKRDAFFARQGMTVARYANSDIRTHFEAVCEDILRRINAESQSLLLEEKVPRRGG